MPTILLNDAVFLRDAVARDARQLVVRVSSKSARKEQIAKLREVVGEAPFTVTRGSRIAQLVVAPVAQARFVVASGTNQWIGEGIAWKTNLPPGNYTAETVLPAVGELVAAMEIVENRYDDLKTLGTPTLIADQVYHRAAAVGQLGGVDWRALPMDGLRGRISVDGAVRDEGVSSDLLGHPLNALAWLASSEVAAAFGGLRAGQTVMLGSVTPPVWLDAPGTIIAEVQPGYMQGDRLVRAAMVVVTTAPPVTA